MNFRGLSLAAGAWFLLLLLRATAASVPTPATGASVDESRVTKILYVDPAHTEAADDTKHGTTDAPFATLGFACQEATKAKNANVGVKIILATGTYRETAMIPAPPPTSTGQPDTDAPLIIEAAEPDQAIIDGADTEGWSPSTWKIEHGRWTHPWPFARPYKAPHRPPLPADSPAYRHGDLVVVNGGPLRQVNTEAELTPGTFWINAARAAGAIGKGHPGPSASVVVQPPEETPLEGAILQVGVRFNGLNITGRRNVVVRGLMIQHTASPVGIEGATGLNLIGCSDVLVEDLLSQWNDGKGLKLAGSKNVTLRRVRTLHNGDGGVAAFQMENLLAEDCEASFNAFRSEWAGWTDSRGSSAILASGIRGGTWRRVHAVGNISRGLLLWDGTNQTVEDSVLQANVINGLAVQSSAGPVSVRRCVISGTKAAPAVSGKELRETGGVALTETVDVSLESNILANNAAAQLVWWEAGGSRAATDAGRQRYRHNVIYGLEPGQLACEMLGDDGWAKLAPAFFRTLDTDQNCFWNPASTEAFVLSVRPGTPPAVLSLTKWQVVLAEHAGPSTAGSPPRQPEASSVWTDPLFVNPMDGDYRLKKNSPVAEWDLPSNEAAGGQ